MKNLLSCSLWKASIVSLCFLYVALTGACAQQQPGKTGINSTAQTTVTGSESGSLNPVQVVINNNGTLLKGRFFMAEGSGSIPTIILLHGFPGNGTDVIGIDSKLSNAGYNVLTFNYSGTFKSEGEFNFVNTQKDIEAAYNFINQPDNIAKFKIDTSLIILGGYSLGGGMAFTYAANHPYVKDVFSIAGNDHGEFIRNYQRDEELKKKIDPLFDEYKSNTEMVRFAPGGIPKEVLEMKIIDSNPTFDLRYCAPFLAPKNILLIGGWNDMNVPIEKIVLPLYRALYTAKAANVKIMAVQDGHSFRKTGDELVKIIDDWIKSNDKK